MEIVFLIIGLITGLLSAWFIIQMKFKNDFVPKVEYEQIKKEFITCETNFRIENSKCKSVTESLKTIETTLVQKNKEINDLSVRLASRETSNENLNLQHHDLKNELRQIKDDTELKDKEFNKLSIELSSLRIIFENAQKTIESQQQTISESKKEIKSKSDEIMSMSKKIPELVAINNSLTEKLETQKNEMEEIRTRFQVEFQNIANQIIEDKSKKFTEINKNNIESILKPLGENIEIFRKKVEETYDKESKQRFSLEEKIKDLVILNNKISEEANNLTNALKGQAKIQGNWGEMILESILEKSGLVKGREYFVQESLKDNNGNLLRPDVIISYPDNRKVVIDSKVSLVAYERFSSIDDKQLQDKYLDEHLKSIKIHIDGLSAKNYQDYVPSLDFTMMFVPIEPAYLFAMQRDPELWNYAYSKHILLISPTNLIAALKLIVDLWKRDYQNKNTLEISEQGAKLYDKFVTFSETLLEVGKHIEKTHENYLEAMKLLKEGKGNLISQSQKLIDLNVKAKKTIPLSILNEADFEENTNNLNLELDSPMINYKNTI